MDCEHGRPLYLDDLLCATIEFLMDGHHAGIDVYREFVDDGHPLEAPVLGGDADGGEGLVA